MQDPASRSGAASPPVTALVTGGTGFIMSLFVRRLLESDPQARAVIVDLGPLAGLAAGALAPVGDRVTMVQGDVRERALFESISPESPVTHIVHAAALTHLPAWERDAPARYVDVNVMGTVNVLEWARGLPGLRQCIYVSTGGVYGRPGPGTPQDLQPETGPFDPPELYAVTKRAAELVSRRYARLFGWAGASVRFSTVFGPMERPTPGRATMSLPYHMMRAALEDRPLRVTEPTLRAAADYLSSEDVAQAMVPMLRAARFAHDAYNIAFGELVTTEALFALFRQVVPAFRYAVVAEDDAEFVMDPAQRLARFNAYAIERMASEFGWAPRPLGEQLERYVRWVMADAERRCPPPAPGMTACRPMSR